MPSYLDYPAGELRTLYRERMKLVSVISCMEERGICASIDRLRETRTSFSEKRAAAAERCREIARRYNYDLEIPRGSNNQSLVRFCFDPHLLALDPIKYGKEQPSFDKGVLDEYEATLEPGLQLDFVRAFKPVRKLSTALGYLASYEKFGIPDPQHPSQLRLHPSLNQTGRTEVGQSHSMKTLRMSSSNPNAQQVCFDGKTEILTTDGWVSFPELNETHAVAQYWKHNKSVDFVFPEIQKHHFKGDMVHITAQQQIDLMVTPAHRCLLRNRQTGQLKDHRADEFKSDYQHFHAGTWAGCDGLDLTEDEVIWLCAVQADGCYTRVKGKDYGIGFGLRKERKIERLRECLQRMGTNFSENVNSSGTTQIYVGTHELAVKLAKRLMPDKCFGSWLIDCNRYILDQFCEEIWLWDGCSTTMNQYSSAIKKNVDWVQIMWTLSGSRAAVVSHLPFEEAAKVQWYVNLTKSKDYSMTTNHVKNRVPWDGAVYCVTVPSSYVIVRRNGKVSVSGNSKQEEANLRYVFGPAPGREWWPMDYENLELKIPGYEGNIRQMIELFERPNDGPFFGSYHLLNASIVYPDLFCEKVCPDCLNEKTLTVEGRKAVCLCPKQKVRLCDIKGGFKKRYEATWYQWIKNAGF